MAPTGARKYASEPVDPMVKIELEAAEALAGLAGEVCWNRREEASRRVENELSSADSVPVSSHLHQDWGVATVPQHFGKRFNILTKPVKAKQDAELKSNPTFAASYPSSGGGKSRQNLTEAEKESRRLRRVLANRESARQTIHRRQALYNELTRKAADLVLENDNLKKEKDLAEKEYDSLRSTNEWLKVQMMKMVKAEEEEIQEESKSTIHVGTCASPSTTKSTTHVDTSTSPSTSIHYIYNHPVLLPFLWPPRPQPSNSVQSQCCSQIPVSMDSERENPINTSGPQTPLYLVPYQWHFPLPSRPETSQNNQSTTSSSSKPVVHLPNFHSLILMNNKTEPSTSTEAMPANNIHENTFGFPPDGGGVCSRGMVFMPAPLSCVSDALTIEYGCNNLQLESICDVIKVSESANSDILKQPKKLVDAVAAAGARKRRKELKRLKNLHCRY